jgi:hypothetical protein
MHGARGKPSIYNGIRSHPSRAIFDKDELYRRRVQCDPVLDAAIAQCCNVHHISNQHKALAVQVGAQAGR